MVQLIFWTCLILLLHTYLFYPLILELISSVQKKTAVPVSAITSLEVIVIMAAYNEEAVIKEKMESLMAQEYPVGQLHFYIGSDDSKDQTNGIIGEYASRNKQIRFFPFQARRGKPEVVNDLVKRAMDAHAFAPNVILVLTDASVIFEKNTIWELVQPFKTQEVAVVDALLVGINKEKSGIAFAESDYVSREVRIKHLEGILWGAMMGPFGGCFAIRSTFWNPIPQAFLVDDFYLTMKALQQGGRAQNAMKAVCRENNPQDIKEEYRRKQRISAGNYQNLWAFRKMLWPVWKPVPFAFWSHKVLRWFGPFFILLSMLCSLAMGLTGNFLFYWMFLLLVILVIGIPALDFVLHRIGVHIPIFRKIRYFFYMNLALLAGFFQYLKGIKNNVWEPTKRN